MCLFPFTFPIAQQWAETEGGKNLRLLANAWEAPPLPGIPALDCYVNEETDKLAGVKPPQLLSLFITSANITLKTWRPILMPKL